MYYTTYVFFTFTETFLFPFQVPNCFCFFRFPVRRTILIVDFFFTTHSTYIPFSIIHYTVCSLLYEPSLSILFSFVLTPYFFSLCPLKVSCVSFFYHVSTYLRIIFLCRSRWSAALQVSVTGASGLLAVLVRHRQERVQQDTGDKQHKEEQQSTFGT